MRPRHARDQGCDEPPVCIDEVGPVAERRAPPTVFDGLRGSPQRLAWIPLVVHPFGREHSVRITMHDPVNADNAPYGEQRRASPAMGIARARAQRA